MYLNHFNLREKPFNISPDSRFLWLSEKHKEGLAILKYGVAENKGFLVLTGDIGTGKTLLINSLIRITKVKALIATIPDPDLETMDFFNLLANEFNMNKVFISKGDFLIEFKRFLLESYASDKSVLLIIDEAQRLNHDLLEQIRLLSNIELDNRKLINIFFVGQSEFNDLIRDDRNRAVKQRISVNYELEPLSKAETSDYIRHRLKTAGATEEILKPDAVREVFNFANGYPRLINVICDLALVTGYSKGLKKISAGVIKDCAKELKIPIYIDKRQNVQSNPARIKTKSVIAVPRSQQRSGFNFGFAVIVLLFMVFVGYQIYGSLTDNSALWKPKEFASQENYQVLEEQKEAFKSEIENKNMAEQDQLTDEIALQEDSETSKNEEALLNPESDNAAEVSKKESSAGGSDEIKSTASIADQRSIIYFGHNSNELPQKAYETLDNIVKFTLQRPDLKITVEGYTDSYGDPIYNRKLSKYRADMVKNYLIGHGIEPMNIIAIGRGPENPIKSNETFEGRKQNRRVEILVKKIR
jgi:general secretion pathway protein A